MLCIIRPKRPRHPRIHARPSLHQRLLDTREPRQRLRPYRYRRRSSSERLLPASVARSRGDDDADGPSRGSSGAKNLWVRGVRRARGSGSCRERRGREEGWGAGLATEAGGRREISGRKAANQVAETKDALEAEFAAHEVVRGRVDGRAVVRGRNAFALLLLRELSEDLCLLCVRRPESAVVVAAVPPHAQSTSLRACWEVVNEERKIHTLIPRNFWRTALPKLAELWREQGSERAGVAKERVMEPHLIALTPNAGQLFA